MTSLLPSSSGTLDVLIESRTPSEVCPDVLERGGECEPIPRLVHVLIMPVGGSTNVPMISTGIT